MSMYLKIVKSDRWLGNGMGRSGATYAIMVQPAEGRAFQEVGRVSLAPSGWQARIGDETVRTVDGKLKTLRHKLETRYGT